MIKTILGMGTAAMDTLWEVAELPKADAFERLKSEKLVPGGSCANMLVTYAGLGGSSKQIAKIGDDNFGLEFKKTLAADGVDTDMLIVKKGGTTLHTYIAAAADGQHCIFSNMGDCLMQLEPEEITAGMLDGVDLFYADLFPCRAAVRMAELAKERSVPVVICLQCPPDFMESVGVEMAEIKDILKYADLIISGRDGYLQLTSEADYIKAVKAVYEQYKPVYGCVCTAGSDGSVWIDAKETVIGKAYEITAVDSTGAGDAFLGALLYSYFHKEENKQQAIDFAGAVGALKCTVWGPRIKVSPQEVCDFMGKY
ncbi:MAG: carbohydrate kinase family protein [Bacillota bacterium]|jgi:sugar/nucleoside kinase (ribokinase family)